MGSSNLNHGGFSFATFPLSGISCFGLSSGVAVVVTGVGGVSLYPSASVGVTVIPYSYCQVHCLMTGRSWGLPRFSVLMLCRSSASYRLIRKTSFTETPSRACRCFALSNATVGTLLGVFDVSFGFQRFI